MTVTYGMIYISISKCLDTIMVEDIVRQWVLLCNEVIKEVANTDYPNTTSDPVQEIWFSKIVKTFRKVLNKAKYKFSLTYTVLHSWKINV